jgi:cytochrome c556
MGTGNVQALAFLAAAFAGAASIVGLKMLGLRQAVVTVVPCLVMAAYASLVVRRYFRSRADQIGDNLYYLGFIFTLISLSVSLAQFASGGSPEEIVANFGVALATTLVGVTLRVVFNQMRMDPVETEKEARLQLAEASRRLKVELMNASSEFSIAARASRQSVADVIDEMGEKLGAVLDGAGQRLTASVEDSASGLAGATRGLQAQVGAAASQLSEASDSMRAALASSEQRWVEGARETGERNAEFNAVARKLSAAVDRLASRLDKGIGPVDGVEARLSGLAQASVGLEAGLRGARSELEAGVAAVGDMRREASDVHAMAAESLASVREQADAIGRAAAALERAETVATVMEKHPDEVRALLADVNGRVLDLVERAERSLLAATANLATGEQVAELSSRMDDLARRPSSTTADETLGETLPGEPEPDDRGREAA